MFAKVALLCAVVAAASASAVFHGVGTGSSAVSRHMDGLGNYAFNYGIASAGAKRNRAEVGDGFGNKATSYSVADSHIAPAYAHAAPAVVAAPALAHGYGLGYAGLAHGLGHAGLAYGLGHAGLGYGLGHAGLGHGLYGHGLGHGYGYGVKLIH